MFSIFNKPSKITLDCFTDQRVIYDAYEPELAKDTMPEWWKKMASTRKFDSMTYQGLDNATLKRCPHVNELLTTGVMFPAWMQLKIKTFDQPDQAMIQTYPEGSPVIPHDPQDYAHHKPNMFHGKVMSPWQIRDTSGTKWLWTSPQWHMTNPIEYWTVPAISEFKYQHATIVNLMVPFNSELTIEPGDPWLHLVPLTEKRIELKTHLVSSEELNKMNSLMMGVGSYARFINRMKKKGK